MHVMCGGGGGKGSLIVRQRSGCSEGNPTVGDEGRDGEPSSSVSRRPSGAARQPKDIFKTFP